MNRHDERKLIVGLLSGSDPGLVREASLQAALGAVRHEVRRRRIARTVSLICAPVLLGLVFLFSSARQPQPVSPVAPSPPPVARAAFPGEPVIEPIDDQELLALLPGRTVVLIGPPGRERLLVFDVAGRLH